MRVLSLDYDPASDPMDDLDRRSIRRIMTERPLPYADRVQTRPLVRTRSGNLVRQRSI